MAVGVEKKEAMLGKLLEAVEIARSILIDAQSKPYYQQKMIDANRELFRYKVKEWEGKTPEEREEEHKKRFCERCINCNDDGTCYEYPKNGMRDDEVIMEHDVLKPYLAYDDVVECVCGNFSERKGEDEQ